MQVLQVQRNPTKLVLQAISQSSWVDWPFRFFSANGNLLRSNFLIGMPILTLRCSMMSSSTHPDQSQVIIQQTQVESFLQRAHVYFPRLLDILPWNRHQKHQQFPITFCLWNLPQLISQPVQLIMLLIGWNTNGNKHNLGSGSASIQVHFATNFEILTLAAVWQGCSATASTSPKKKSREGSPKVRVANRRGMKYHNAYVFFNKYTTLALDKTVFMHHMVSLTSTGTTHGSMAMENPILV